MKSEMLKCILENVDLMALLRALEGVDGRVERKVRKLVELHLSREEITVDNKVLKKLGFINTRPIGMDVDAHWELDHLKLHEDSYDGSVCFATEQDRNGNFKHGLHVSSLSMLNRLYYGINGKYLPLPIDLHG